ncbi:MAG: N-acetylmuramoyl-L-alanine amidase [Clostridia bacterium]|nr:N-acetylmuramoyl-L-alanine amidase [Clostridia bacterium]
MKECAVTILSIIVFSVCIFLGINQIEKNISETVNSYNKSQFDNTVILDAGHGGEDGGAVAFDGTLEKDINLEICSAISLFFDIFGINYINIRTEDISVGDTTLETIKERKASDIYKRYDIINTTENSILLSIHQNMFSVEKYSGTQVFYAKSVDSSKNLAQCIQSSVVSSLQNNNKRSIKEGDKSIYLLYNAKRPSVLVECGFMSNMEELALLNNFEYRTKISYFIVSGLLEYLLSQKVV